MEIFLQSSGSVVQWLEQQTLNLPVAGSNPARPTKERKGYDQCIYSGRSYEYGGAHFEFTVTRKKTKEEIEKDKAKYEESMKKYEKRLKKWEERMAEYKKSLKKWEEDGRRYQAYLIKKEEEEERKLFAKLKKKYYKK